MGRHLDSVSIARQHRICTIEAKMVAKSKPKTTKKPAKAKKPARAKKPAKPTAPKKSKNPAVEAVRAFALSYPEAHEDFPWGDRVIKVRGKIFVFMGREDELGIGVKLPISNQVALMLPFTEPSGYGMGKHGWINASFPAGEDVPMDMIEAWIDESYRANAPKKLVDSLTAAASPAPAAPARRRTARRR
jgi:predicted DNA-binding protein (MmcQ/YjbR family)